MPALPTLEIQDSTGTVKETLTADKATRTQSLVDPWSGTVTLDRDAWTAVYPSNVDEITDRFVIRRGNGSVLHAGRFGSDQRDGNDVVVEVVSYERDAQDAEPTPAREIYENVADSTVFQDAIDAVPTLQSGTVKTGASSVSFTFANADQSKKIRDAADPAGIEVAYNNDRSVDFVSRLGVDKPNTTISNTVQNIVESLDVEDNSRDPVTHIRGLGAQQGGEQVTADATIASYSAGERQVWREYANKDIVQRDRLKQIVDRLASNFDAERRQVVVNTTLVDLDPSLGDRYSVDLSEHDINRMLRIIELTERITSAGRRFRATLTNRNPERGGERKDEDDLGRFNRGDQGFVDRDTDSYGWQPVTSTLNATRPYPYPDDVVREDKAEVIVSSIPYRAYSQGAASGGGLINTSGDNTEFETVEGDGTSSLNTGWSGISPGELVLWDFSVGNSGAVTFMQARVNPTGLTHSPDFELYWRNTSTGDEFPTNRTEYIGIDDDETMNIAVADPSDTKPEDFELVANQTDSSSGDGALEVTALYQVWGEHVHTSNLPDHTHDPEPGLIEFGTETVTNAELIVNGTTILFSPDSGEFTTTVDVSPYLTPGSNDIQLSSDTLGLVNLTVETQLFRSGGPAP